MSPPRLHLLSLSLSLVLPGLFGLACTPKDAVDETGSGEETGETGETGDTSEDACPEGWEGMCEQPWYDALSTGSAEGLRWEEDRDFFLENFSVPHVVALHEGGFRMTMTLQSDKSNRYMARSDDGLAWTVDAEPFLRPTDFTGDCEGSISDTSEVYRAEGGYRLLVEIWNGETASTRICSAVSADGEAWTVEEGLRYEATSADVGVSSVWGLFWNGASRVWQGYYVGDWTGTNGIRVARSSDGRDFENQVAENVLPTHIVDPEPVRLREGGIRLYSFQMAEGYLEAFDSADGVSFESRGRLEGLSDDTCDMLTMNLSPGDKCRPDSTFLRLPDGSMYLYFGSIYVNEQGASLIGLRRARALP